jgi:hypothetical protein
MLKFVAIGKRNVLGNLGHMKVAQPKDRVLIQTTSSVTLPYTSRILLGIML